MKLFELKGTEKPKGTYMAVEFTSDTNARIKRFIEKNEIPNGLKKDYHTTVIYSRTRVPELEARGKLKTKLVGKPTKLDTFDTHDGPVALVLLYDCPELTERHSHIMDTTNATYDYPDYNIHITLSYDIDGSDMDALKKLPVDTIGDIIISYEFVEDFDVDWTPDND